MMTCVSESEATSKWLKETHYATYLCVADRQIVRSTGAYADADSQHQLQVAWSLIWERVECD